MDSIRRGYIGRVGHCVCVCYWACNVMMRAYEKKGRSPLFTAAPEFTSSYQLYSGIKPDYATLSARNLSDNTLQHITTCKGEHQC
jgi:hypothetical protein